MAISTQVKFVVMFACPDCFATLDGYKDGTLVHPEGGIGGPCINDGKWFRDPDLTMELEEIAAAARKAEKAK